MEATPVDIGPPARRASEPANRRGAIRPAIGLLALLVGHLAVQMPQTQSRFPGGLDDGGWLSLAVLAAVPVLVGALAAAGFCWLYPRSGKAGTRTAAGTGDRIRAAARRDVRWAALAAAAGAVVALGSDTNVWVTRVGVLCAVLV